MGISKKNTKIEIIVEPKYATPAVSKSPKLKSPVPMGIAPFNSIKGNIETKSVATYSFWNMLSKNFPNA